MSNTEGRGWFKRYTPWLLLLALCLGLAQSEGLWRWDKLIYDAQLRFWSRPAPTDIVIVAIDEDSLAALGRWPWNRRTHAQLIDRLSAAGAQAIALDIILAEPAQNDPGSDQALATALRASGRVVLPVLAEQSRQGGPLIETLPTATLAAAATTLAHVHVELDPDGVARSVYLLEGLGAPRWPNLALALTRIGSSDTPGPLPGIANPQPGTQADGVWTRDRRLLIPYAGPPGHFLRYSYADVLAGRFPPEAFRGKRVLVGATASGLGDNLPTPVSGYNQAMPGVEINANIADILLRGINLRPVQPAWRLLLTGAFVLLPLLLFPRGTPRRNLITSVLLVLMCLLFSLLLLRLLHLWFTPAAAVLGLVLSYPLWSWRRLEAAMHYLRQELLKLHAEPVPLPDPGATRLADAARFLQRILPITGWTLCDRHGVTLVAQGDAPGSTPKDLPLGLWTAQDGTQWMQLIRDNTALILGFRWQDAGTPNPAQQTLLDALQQQFHRVAIPTPRDTVELVEARIQQVQQASERLRTLQHFVTDTLEQMADGVLVVNALGSVQLANQRALLYLDKQRSTDLIGQPIHTVLAPLSLNGDIDWDTLLRTTLLEHQSQQAEARISETRDLLVNISPLLEGRHGQPGAIINLADITPLKASERRRTELLGFLSHDLRSPLVSLLAILELARDQQPSVEITELLSRIGNYGQHTLNLAEEFLHLARAESSESVPLHEVDLVNVAYNALEQVWAQAQAQSIELRPEINLDAAWVLGDGSLLERTLINLLDNAIKYGGSGRLVRLTLDKDGAEYRCGVIDQGQGIPTQELPLIFNRFHRVPQQVQQQRKGAGLGLGLALVKAVAHRHHGSIAVDSTLGQGTSFYLRLPAAG